MKRKREKHLPYYRVLEALQRSRTCALCEMESAAVTRYFEGIFYEKVNDPSIRDDLRRSRGFCARHAHRLTDFGDGLGTAILYQDQVALIVAAVDEAARPPERRRTRSAREPRARCPACLFAEQARARNIRTLVESLDDADMLAALRNSPGLCYPHLEQALESAAEGQRVLLVEIHRPKLAALRRALEEYQRKQDYRFAGESEAGERDSWLRAVDLAVGSKGVF